MIKINLLGEQIVAENNHKFQIGIFVGTLIMVIFICGFLQRSLGSEISSLTEQKSDLEAELERLKKVTSEVKDLETKRKELETKLAIIAKLKKSKTGPVHVLDDLNISLPEKAWLKEIREADEFLKIDGYALDNQTIAGFMKDLEKSDFFSNIDLVETKQSMKAAIKIKEFSIKSKISYAGKIVEAPVEESDKDQKAEKKG